MVSDPVDITRNPVFWRQKQEDFEFEVRLDCIDRLSLKQNHQVLWVIAWKWCCIRQCKWSACPFIKLWEKNIFLRHFILVFTSKLQPVPSSAIFIFNRIGIWSSTQNSEKYKRILRVYWSWYLWCFGESHLPVSKFSASSEVKTCCILRSLTKQLVWSVFCMKILETMYLTGVVFCWAYTHLRS